MADTQAPQQDNAATNDGVRSKERLGTRCCYCLCQTLWVFLVLIVIIVMLVILVLYIIITPRSFKFHVSNLSLTQFDYTSNTNTNTLRYNLVLNITARNPNKKLKIYYDIVQAHALYQRVEFSTRDVDLPWRSYLQDKKATNVFSAVFSGQRVMMLNRKQEFRFQEDNKDGVFPIDIKIKFRIRFRLGNLQSGHFNARAKCELDAPLADSNGKTMAAAFHSTKCEVDF
ncbi:hypothetical protein VNO78_21113 [Psophocarpus tetragonolobus]|uniref:Late embryogenesis abundant protein LEA-2 subgroup domain-containing protein n=1 Tax=Psophocarpus tetragonolobus TaxID=3891 RepID=A0AAN9SC61_PSOTE